MHQCKEMTLSFHTKIIFIIAEVVEMFPAFIIYSEATSLEK
jgi:flagellar biosynthesis protein FliQ